MSPQNSYVTGARRQRGAIGLLAAATLSLALLCTLVVLDSGRLYLEKRSLQRVADVAALEAASRKGNCTAGSAATYANQSATRNGFTVGNDGRTLSASCGTLLLDAASRRTFSADPSKTEAIKVVVSHSVPRSIAAGIGAMFGTGASEVNVDLSATAVAAIEPPLAKLTLRSTLATVDSSKSIILNQLIGGLLGGALSLDVGSWQGLVDSKLSMLAYLNRLKTDLNLSAVNYDEVLASNVSVGQLIQTAFNVLQSGNTLDSRITLANQQALKAAAGTTTVVLGDLVKIKGGGNLAALDTDLSAFDFLQSLAQLANKKNGVAANLQLTVPNLLQVKAIIKVIEPPQLSAIGDPSKINSSVPVLNDPDRIYVRTAQMRALVSINLEALDGLPKLLNETTTLVKGLTPVLNAALGLDIKGLLGSVGCLLGSSCMVTDFRFLTATAPAPANAGPRIDLSLSLAAAESYVTGYTCTSNTDKSLTFHTNTALVSTKVGLIDEAAAFPANTDPAAIVAKPIPILNIRTQICKQIAGILGSCSTPVDFGGGGLGISFNTLDKSPLGSPTGTNATVIAPNLPEISQTPYFPPKVASQLPSTLLDGVISGVKVNVYQAVTPTAVGSVITGAGGLLGNILVELDGIVEDTLKPLLTKIVDPLLDSLGITVAPADVGANLSCNFGQATLVI